jgi:hypothetical protein
MKHRSSWIVFNFIQSDPFDPWFDNSILSENHKRLSSRPQRQANPGAIRGLERGVEGSRRIFTGDNDPRSSSRALSHLPVVRGMLVWQEEI